MKDVVEILNENGYRTVEGMDAVLKAIHRIYPNGFRIENGKKRPLTAEEEMQDEKYSLEVIKGFVPNETNRNS